jgi:drug/metabolite transporter (DMT)-like permease
MLKKIIQNIKESKYSGLFFAGFSAFCLGLTPIFGKVAINSGFPSIGVVAFRTIFSTIILGIGILLTNKSYFKIYLWGFLGCALAGLINGVGSLFFYNALNHIDASLGQLLYATYPFFVMFWSFIDGHKPTKISIIQISIAIPSIFFLLSNSDFHSSWIGIFSMLLAAILYALHLPINQRVLYEMPAPTVTFYTLLSMSLVVSIGLLVSNKFDQIPTNISNWEPIFFLTIVTVLSRITLFLGVKKIGGTQTAIIGLGELIVTVFISVLFLKESLSLIQWIGAFTLAFSVFLSAFDKNSPKPDPNGGIFKWLSPMYWLTKKDNLF